MSSLEAGIKVEPALAVKVESLNDLARLASSATTLGHMTYIVHFEEDSKHYYGIFIVFRDYYRLYGLPMFYYYVTEKPLSGNYILFRMDDSGEELKVSKGTKPGYIVIPVVNVSEKPAVLR
ncbi:MAG: cren protein [Thermofilum sp.]|jgi:hypothetical protein|nr:cren protein [Thermofilum sp.]